MKIDGSKDYITKSKLIITVKTSCEYKDRTRVAAKQTNKQTQTDTEKYLGNNTKTQKNILTDRPTGRVTSGHRKRDR